MCGRLRLDDMPEVLMLLALVGVTGTPIYSPDISPASMISIIRQKEEREIVTSRWWLCLDPKTLKPNYKLKSFNSRSDRLYDDFKAASYKPFRVGRCIIPATAFIEGHEDNGTHHIIEIEDRAIAFGGLYREYVNTETGEIQIANSLITLGAIDEWANIHPDSFPLMLDYTNRRLIDRWLDPKFDDVEYFRPLMEPRVMHSQRVHLLDGKVSRWGRTGEPFIIEPKAA